MKQHQPIEHSLQIHKFFLQENRFQPKIERKVYNKRTHSKNKLTLSSSTTQPICNFLTPKATGISLAKDYPYINKKRKFVSFFSYIDPK